MAVKKTETKEVVKEEIVVDTKKDAEIEKLQKEKEQMSNDLESLKTQMALLMKQMSLQSAIAPQEEKEVEVTCYCINGGVITNNDGSVRYDIKYKESAMIPMSELKECFKAKMNDYRVLFRKGMFVFEDKDVYADFKIKDIIDMSDDVLVEMLNKGEIPYQDKMEVGGNIDFILSNTLIYRVADLRRAGKLKDLSYGNQKKFETYFDVTIDSCINQLELLHM